MLWIMMTLGWNLAETVFFSLLCCHVIVFHFNNLCNNSFAYFLCVVFYVKAQTHVQHKSFKRLNFTTIRRALWRRTSVTYKHPGLPELCTNVEPSRSTHQVHEQVQFKFFQIMSVFLQISLAKLVFRYCYRVCIFYVMNMSFRYWWHNTQYDKTMNPLNQCFINMPSTFD